VSGKVDGGFGGTDPFGNLTQGVEGFGEVVSLTEGVAEAIVSTEFAAGGGDEVADACDSDEGFEPATIGETVGDHFFEAARHESSFGVVSESEAVGESASDSKNVFEGASDFDSDNVVGGVHPVGWAHEGAADSVGSDRVSAGGNGGSWDSACDFDREVGTAEDGDFGVGKELLDHFGHEFASGGFEAFGGEHDQRMVAFELREDWADGGGRHGDDRHGGAFE